VGQTSVCGGLQPDRPERKAILKTGTRKMPRATGLEAHRGNGKDRVGDILARLAKAISKPGIDRAHIFRSESGKPVYAYFVSSEDPSKIVREDVLGRRTVGRLAGGRFRAVRSSKPR
jgi:hypothetical protein